MNTQELITSAEAADILGVDRSTLSRWSDERLQPDERRLDHHRLSSGAKLYDRGEVEALKRQLDAERAEASA